VANSNTPTVKLCLGNNLIQKELDMQQVQWAPEFNQGLTNHLPMAIQALQSMHATTAQIGRLSSHLAPSLDVLTQPANQKTLSEAQVKALVGKRSHYSELLNYFTQLLNGQSIEQRQTDISKWLDFLLPGLSAAAFHPMIRLAHAISSDSETNTKETPYSTNQYDKESETPNALAYWVFAYQELAWPVNQLRSSSSLSDTIDALINALTDNLSWPANRLGKSLVTDDMQKVQQHFSFDGLTLKPAINEITLIEMEEAILNLYLATDDFTILHGVTATYAARIIIDKYNPKQMLTYLWQGLVIAFLSKGVNVQHIQETQQKLLDIKALTTKEIKHRACNSLDSHTIKLAAACLKMYTITQNNQYLLAASRKLQNDKSAVLSL
jgi:hypothetical protein